MANEEDRLFIPVEPSQLFDKIKSLEKENKRLREALEEILETVYWMSGSTDFSPGGQAHKGWVKAQPKIEKARRALEGRRK